MMGFYKEDHCKTHRREIDFYLPDTQKDETSLFLQATCTFLFLAVPRKKQEQTKGER